LNKDAELVNKRGFFQKNLRQKGQSLVEFALVLPLLLILVLGAMDIGRLFYMKIIITNAAREGAYYLSIFPEDKVSSYTDTYLAIEAEGRSSTIEIFIDGTENDEVDILNCCTQGEEVGVRVTKEADLVLGGILQSLGIVGGPIELSSTVRMIVQ